jgi:hypothetical protein
MAPLFGDAVFFLHPVKMDTGLVTRRSEVKAALESVGATLVKRLEAQSAALAPRVIRLVCDPNAVADPHDPLVRACVRVCVRVRRGAC